MSSEWLETSIANIVEIISGGTPKTTNNAYWNGNIPWLSVADFNTGYRYVGNTEKSITERGLAESATRLLEKGDIIISARGTVGVVAQLSRQMAFNQSCYGIRGKAGVSDTDYIYYLLKNTVSEMKQISHGAVFDTITRDTFKLLTVNLPPVKEQQKISSILGALDDRITLLRETNATLEEIAQSIFKSWFVDFDPVRAKQEGRAPEGMDGATAALFPDSFEESELGLVPKGWKVASVYEIANVIYGAPFASKRFSTEKVGTPLIRIRDLKDEKPGIYTDETHPKGYLTKPGDIIVGMDGEFRAYLWGGELAWLNQRVCVFKPVADISACFVHLSIKPLLAAVEASETATTVIHLGKNDIDRFRVLIPNHEILDAFGIVANSIYEKIVTGKQSTKTLSDLRDTLLPRLISGQLRLPEAEAMLEQA